MEIESGDYTVYVHISPNKKRYVGITKQEPRKRWAYGKGYRKNQSLFYNAIQKYGWENFEHYILFEGVSKDFAIKKERELIKLWKTNNRKYGYNITLDGEGVCGIAREESYKPVDLYDLEGNFIKGFISMTEASYYLFGNAIEVRNISKCCYGMCVTVKNKYIFRLKGENFDKYRTNHIDKVKVCQYDLNGNLLKIYNSIKEAEFLTNTNNISLVCIGKRISANGYIWRYEDDTFDKYETTYKKNLNPITQYDFYGNKIATYNNMKIAIEKTGVSNISGCCRGIIPSAGGYIWRYEKDNFDKYNFDYYMNYKICQFSLDGKLIKIYDNIHEANKTGIRHIGECCKNKLKVGKYQTAGNYIWKYIIDCTEEELSNE